MVIQFSLSIQTVLACKCIPISKLQISHIRRYFRILPTTVEMGIEDEATSKVKLAVSGVISEKTDKQEQGTDSGKKEPIQKR